MRQYSIRTHDAYNVGQTLDRPSCPRSLGPTNLFTKTTQRACVILSIYECYGYTWYIRSERPAESTPAGKHGCTVAWENPSAPPNAKQNKKTRRLNR